MKTMIISSSPNKIDYIGVTKKNFQNEKERIVGSTKNLLKRKI